MPVKSCSGPGTAGRAGSPRATRPATWMADDKGLEFTGLTRSRRVSVGAVLLVDLVLLLSPAVIAVRHMLG
jgi:hypothetical protein